MVNRKRKVKSPPRGGDNVTKAQAKKAVKRKKQVGRPTGYKPRFCKTVLGMTKLTHADMAKSLGIGLTSFYKYKDEFTKFANAIKETDQVTDNVVVSSLFKLATGYEVKEIHEEAVRYENAPVDKEPVHGEAVEEPVITKEVARQRTVTRHITPSPTAIIFWLKNRMPEDWRDKKEVQIEEIIVDIEGMD